MNIRVMALSVFLAGPWAASARAADDGLVAEELRGTIRTEEAAGVTAPVAGANVFWLGTTVGTTSNASGAFAIRRVTGHARLVIRHAAYLPDTVLVTDTPSVTVTLRPSEREVEEVSVTGERTPTTIDYLSPESKIRMGEQELTKAACCNLSESFETNPSVDVTFTDAITGTRQIEMLGLSGIYAQTTLENLPYIRGLTSNVGLTFIPGTWIEAISVSKGIGSVANGYESITGQIDVDLRKPQREDEPRLFANAFGNQDARLEGNLNLRQPLGEHWSSMTSAARQLAEDGDRRERRRISGHAAIHRTELRAALQLLDASRLGRSALGAVRRGQAGRRHEAANRCASPGPVVHLYQPGGIPPREREDGLRVPRRSHQECRRAVVARAVSEPMRCTVRAATTPRRRAAT